MSDITYTDYDTVTSNQIFIIQFKHIKLFFLTPAWALLDKHHH